MTENKVVTKTEAQDQQKQEHKEERTVAGRFFKPQTDIVENKESLIITMDLPGVKKEDVSVSLTLLKAPEAKPREISVK